MTPAQIALVQESWKKVVPIQTQAATLFYGRLFELDPALRRLFTTDMTEQGRKLMAMIAVVVNGLSRLDTLVPAVRDLGRRHREYGVHDADYTTVGAALLWTLERGLGDDYREDVAEAWRSAYAVLSETMRKA